jgi:hypothetical protein
MGLLGGTSGREEKDEGAIDRAKDRIKEVGGALTGDKKLRARFKTCQSSLTLQALTRQLRAPIG